MLIFYSYVELPEGKPLMLVLVGTNLRSSAARLACRGERIGNAKAGISGVLFARHEGLGTRMR